MSSWTALTCLCALVVFSLPGVGGAQFEELGRLNGGDDARDFGKRVLMVNGQAFAFGIDQENEAHLYQWAIGESGFQPEPGGSPLASTPVMVGRHPDGAIMAFGTHVTIYRDTGGEWDADVRRTREGAGEDLLPIEAMVRRTTPLGRSTPPLVVTFDRTEEYLVNVGDQTVSPSGELQFDRIGVLSTPIIVRTANCLIVASGGGLGCYDAGTLTEIIAPGAADITQFDASDTHIAVVLAGGTASLVAGSSVADVLVTRPNINNLVLSENRLALASEDSVEVFLYQDPNWCLEGSITTPGVASMDFSENEQQLLLGIPSGREIQAYQLPPARMGTCASPSGDAGPGSDGGPDFDGGPGFDAGPSGDLVNRADLSCTCRVGTQSPSPFALISGALCLGVLLRRRRR